MTTLLCCRSQSSLEQHPQSQDRGKQFPLPSPPPHPLPYYFTSSKQYTTLLNIYRYLFRISMFIGNRYWWKKFTILNVAHCHKCRKWQYLGKQHSLLLKHYIYRKKGCVLFDNVLLLHNGIEGLICLCLCQLNCKKQF